jgi:hypothetical protein
MFVDEQLLGVCSASVTLPTARHLRAFLTTVQMCSCGGHALQSINFCKLGTTVCDVCGLLDVPTWTILFPHLGLKCMGWFEALGTRCMAQRCLIDAILFRTARCLPLHLQRSTRKVNLKFVALVRMVGLLCQIVLRLFAGVRATAFTVYYGRKRSKSILTMPKGAWAMAARGQGQVRMNTWKERGGRAKKHGVRIKNLRTGVPQGVTAPQGSVPRIPCGRCCHGKGGGGHGCTARAGQCLLTWSWFGLHCLGPRRIKPLYRRL